MLHFGQCWSMYFICITSFYPRSNLLDGFIPIFQKVKLQLREDKLPKIHNWQKWDLKPYR